MSILRSLLVRMPVILAVIACQACSGGSNSSNAPAASGGTGAGGRSAASIPSGGQGGSIAGNSPEGGAAPNTNPGGAGSCATAGVGGVVASGGSAGSSDGKGLTLYYIRHAEVVGNTVPADQVTYENSETITDFGYQQIDALTTYLQGLNLTPDAVLVSPTKRTQKTIEPYLVAKGLQGQIWMELAECCTRTATGAALPTTPRYSPLKATLESPTFAFRDSTATKYWQNDSYEEGLFMVTTAKNLLLAQYGQSGKTIVVVGHAAAGQVLIGLLRGVDVSQGAPTTGTNAVFLLNTGIMRLIQDSTGLFKLDGRNINNPTTK